MLRDVQLAFAAALLPGNTDTGAAAACIRGGRLSPESRIDIYRHNVLTNLRGALMDIYPVVRRVVGDAFFIHAADGYVAAHGSPSGDLNRFGAAWPLFLANYPHGAGLPYLPDVARMEWAWHESFHAADSAGLDLIRLASVPADAHGGLRFRLQPGARLLASSFPILRIWQVNQPDYTGALEIDWSAPGDNLLIHRDGTEVVVRTLPAGQFRFLSALSCGAALEAATVAAAGADPQFDLQGFLIESVQSGIIVDFEGDGTCNY